ncbi:UDP-D-xylose:L-fucose alpha-1,3-D-xylosyltransferase 3 [Holothuria leucospilota]|uniref:UDP-D-xylose:L-fucose alpha-1,3-D-xylosyltransferase 3 n=1 Tax=Holothuria leucospilota TaxID=206669 RepID=A0A9Q1HIS3_HOLLE|nr:UDP-D-xylose:L-fucose alpha-1,3-D-xylosyltransferase 3 [Holothuria leucospilota]
MSGRLIDDNINAHYLPSPRRVPVLRGGNLMKAPSDLSNQRGKMEPLFLENGVTKNATSEKTLRSNASYQFVNFTDCVRTLTSPVLLVTTNYGFFNLTLNLLYSIQRLSMQPKILILCEDRTVYVELWKRQINFGLKFQLTLTHLEESDTIAASRNTPTYYRIMQKRISYLEILLQRGLDVFFVDSDIVLLANPFKYFTDDNSDIFVQRDVKIACAGFFYMKANNSSKNFVEAWKRALPKDPKGNQKTFNKVIKELGKNIKVNRLPKELFMSGSEYNKFQKGWPTPQPVEVHANYMIGKDTKENWLKKYKLWFVPD